METLTGFIIIAIVLSVLGLAGLFYIHIWYLLAKSPEALEPSVTRDIHLTVPKDSSVNTQITSGNNTVNLTDL